MTNLFEVKKILSDAEFALQEGKPDLCVDYVKAVQEQLVKILEILENDKKKLWKLNKQ